MEPNEEISSQWTMKDVIFPNLSTNFYGCELPQNYFSLYKKLGNRSKFSGKNLERIYIARDN